MTQNTLSLRAFHNPLTSKLKNTFKRHQGYSLAISDRKQLTTTSLHPNMLKASGKATRYKSKSNSKLKLSKLSSKFTPFKPEHSSNPGIQQSGKGLLQNIDFIACRE